MTRGQKYIEDVLSGNILTGQYIKLACKRHLSDLERAKTDEFPYYFDEAKANNFIRFFENCYHWKGEFAGTKIKAEPHQVFYFMLQYGWRRKVDGLMRFDKVFKTVGRKNAKTTEEAVKALYHLVASGESGAQVWAGATKKEQAHIVINDAGNIAQETPPLKFNFKHYRYRGIITRVVFNETSFMAAIGADSHTEDGLDPSWIIIDEYHAHPDDGVLNILDSGRGSRRQSVVNMITTAGYNRQGPCYSNKRKHAVDVLTGRVVNDRFLALLYEMDEEDDWMDETMWVKANPNINVSVKWEFLQSRFVDAKNEGGTTEVDFKTKNLNMWVGSAKTWIPDDIWKACDLGGDISDLDGQLCYGGLDLANVSDTIAFSLWFPGEPHRVLTWYWIPEETVQLRIKKESVNYLNWIKNGNVRITPGNVRDDDILIKDIDEIIRKYRMKAAGYDDWEAYNIIPKLIELGHNFERFPQNYSTFNSPIKELYKMAFKRELNHFGNPVTRWQVGNVVLRTDPGGRVKFDKESAADKIDGIVSIAESVGVYLAYAAQGEFHSVYDDENYSMPVL